LLVRVRLYGNLRRFAPGQKEELEWEMPPKSSVMDLIKSLGIAEGEVWIVSINDQLADVNQLLEDGDDVRIFAPVAGGTERVEVAAWLTDTGERCCG